MVKNILILNGSPRPKGNSSTLIKSFTEGAEKAGHKVTMFSLDRMNINGCRGCFGGGADPASPCVQKDDMDKIYPVFKEADIIVLGSPLYFWNLSGQLRTAFDRLFAIAEIADEDFYASSKSGILLMAAEGHEFDEAANYYDVLMKHLKWHNLGKVLVGGVRNIGDIKGNPGLKEAKELGKSIK